jgi:hypothetical protein
MNATHAFLLVEALQATAIVGAALALMLCALRHSALRHALGVVGLGLLLASPLLTLALPRPAWLLAVAPPVAPEAAPAMGRIETPPPELVDSVGENFVAAGGYAWPDESAVETAPPIDAFAVAEDIEPSAPAQAPAHVVSGPTRPAAWDVVRKTVTEHRPLLIMGAGVLWMLGALWCVIRWGRSRVRLRRLRASLGDWPAARPIADAGTICAELGLRALPPIRVSEIAPMPLVLGVLRPVIVLPPGCGTSSCTRPHTLRGAIRWCSWPSVWRRRSCGGIRGCTGSTAASAARGRKCATTTSSAAVMRRRMPSCCWSWSNRVPDCGGNCR